MSRRGASGGKHAPGAPLPASAPRDPYVERPGPATGAATGDEGRGGEDSSATGANRTSLWTTPVSGLAKMSSTISSSPRGAIALGLSGSRPSSYRRDAGV